VLRDTLQYRYRADQLLESELLPRGAVVHVSYDPFDRVGKQWILDPVGNRHVVLDTVLYGRDGSVDSVSMGSRLGQRIGYDSIFGLVDRVGMFKGGSPLSPLEWQRRYNQAMELSQEVRPGGEKAQFDWDNLGRLTGVRYPSGVSTGKPNLQYGWNEDGVRTSMVHDYGRSDWTLPDGSMQPTRVTSTHEGVVNQAWDWRGNLTRTGRYASAADASAGEAAWSSVYGSGTTSDSLWLQRRDFRYNSDDGLERAILMRGAEGGRRDTSILGYVLDGSGLMVGSLRGRVIGVGDTAWTVSGHRVYEGPEVVSDSGYGGWRYRVGSAELVQDSTGAWVTRFVFTDALGTPYAVLNDTGAVLGRWQFDAFGNLERYEGDASGQTPYLFAGKEFDAELGLYWMGVRLYDPVSGQFVSRDALEEFWNPYSYVGENPLMVVA
jgi:RHS repeat-associated protein